jgi:hypothetical protein
MSRAGYNRFFTRLSIVVGFVSLVLGLASSFKLGPSGLKAWGPFVVGIWVLFPPIFLWFHWVCFSDEFLKDPQARDFVRHAHDLSRNIWIALAGILAYLFGIPLLGTVGNG